MNDSMTLKTVRETKISEFYKVKNVFTAEEHKTLFTDSVIIGFLLVDDYTIFLVPEYDEYFPIQDRLAYNATQYSNQDLLNLFDGEYPYVVDQIIVCTPYEVIDQRPSKISEEELNCLANITIIEDERGTCKSCGNTRCTCDPSYDTFLQSEHDKYYHLKQKVDAMEQLDRAVKQAPPEIHNSMPAYMLDKEPYIKTATFIKDDMTTFEFFKEFLNSHEYVYAITDKFSVVIHTAYLVGGDSSFSIEDYYKLCNRFYAIELNQDAKDRAAFMNTIGKKEVQPPAIKQEDIPVHPLATDMACALIVASSIFVILVTAFIAAYYWIPLGWFSLTVLMGMVLYTVWQATYMDNHPSRLSREEFNEKFGQ
jgi:hypothetical protein